MSFIHKKFETTSRRKKHNELPCHKYLVELKRENRRRFITLVCVQMIVGKVTQMKNVLHTKNVCLVKKMTLKNGRKKKKKKKLFYHLH